MLPARDRLFDPKRPSEIVFPTPIDVAPPKTLDLAEPKPGVEHEQYGEVRLRPLRVDGFE